jgi:adhesin transport system outer membrane protein
MLACTKLSLFMSAILALPCAQAQGLPEPLIEAARKAVASNPEVQARWNGFKAAGNERDVVRGGLLPQLDLTASLGQESRSLPTLGSGNNNTSTQLTFSQMLFDGWFTPSEIKRLGYAKLTRYYELAEAFETVALEAVRAYIDVVRYRELVEVATQNYAEHRQITGLVEERAKAGVGPRIDLEQAVGRVALAESSLLIELTNLHDVSARYMRIVGESPPTSLAPLAEPFKLGVLPTTTDALMRVGLQGSPTLNAAVENVRASTAAIESRKAAYLPRLELRANTGTNNSTNGTAGNTQANGVQLVLNYNLFRGGADMARERQAVNQKEQARDLQEKACRDVRQTLSIAFSDVRSLNEQQIYLNQHRLSIEKLREAYRQQFEIGQRTLLDMLDNQNEYFEATRASINARYNQAFAQARTLAGMGQLVAALGVSRADTPSAQDAGQDRSGIDPAELCPLDRSAMNTLEQLKAQVVPVPRARVTVPMPPALVAQAPTTAPALVRAPAAALALAPASAPAQMQSPVAALAQAPTNLNLTGDALFDYKKTSLKPEGMFRLDNLVANIRPDQLKMAPEPASQLSVAAAESDVSGVVVGPRGHGVNVGLFALSANAERVRAQLEDVGLPVVSDPIKSARGPLTRVRVGPFEQREQAQVAAERVRALGLDAHIYAPRVVVRPRGHGVNVGLFALPANAERVRAQLEDVGLPVVSDPIKSARGPLTRVRVGPFEQREQAQVAAERVRALGLDAHTYAP